jgi:copper chaperone CopZ
MARVKTMELTVESNAIHCSGCENRIQGALGKLPGVQKVKASHKNQKIVLVVDQEKTPLRDVLAKLEFLGYNVAQNRSRELP